MLCYGMREVNGRYDKIAVSFPLLAEKAPEQLKFALDQALGFLKSQVQVWISILDLYFLRYGDVLKYRSVFRFGNVVWVASGVCVWIFCLLFAICLCL